MKNLIIGILIAVIGTLFTFYLNSKKADIRYSLSEKIPVRFLKEKSQENIQQLTIKNNGSSEAKKIKIDIKGQINDYDIFPYSKSDLVEKFPAKNSLEIVYSSLPPEGSFKIIIKTIGDEINERDLNIAHTEGSGKAALTKENYSFLDFIIPIGGILYVVLIINSAAKDIWETRAKYAYDELLKRTKPFYLGKNKWDSLRKKAIEEKIDKDKYAHYTVERSNGYLVLSSKKPDYLNEEEWKKLIYKAAESLSAKFAETIARSYDEKNILELLKICKPEFLPEKEWETIQVALNDRFFYLRQRYSYTSDILKEIQETKPENINANSWLKYRQDLLKKFKEHISKAMELKKEPIIFLEKQDLSSLAKEDIELLQDRAYKLELNNISTVFLQPESARKFMETEKPFWLKDPDYETIKKRAITVLETDQIHQENIAKQKNLFNEIEITSKLKNKIENQLRIIHEVLNDPSAADRIEEYNNVFAPGNFKNLKDLSLLNKKRNSEA